MKWFQEHYRLQIKFLPTTVVLIALVICIALGFWQLRRAEFKHHIQEQYDERIMQAPLTLAQLSKLSQSDLDFYPVRMHGRFDNEHVILLDNKTFQGRPGYEVVMPFVIAGDDRVVLINRGWIPRASRNQIPHIEPVYGNESLYGYVKTLEEKAFRLGDNIETTRSVWPLRAQQLDKISMPEIAKHLGRPLYPFVLLLAPEQPGQLQRIWQPVVANANKHQGYAVQWFLLACVLGVFLVIVNVRKK